MPQPTRASDLVRQPAVRSRRRGEALEHAVYAATLAELCDLGYGGLSMEGSEARARPAKAAMYRRWPTKRALVLAALRHAMPPPPQPRADRSARQNLTAIFEAHPTVLAGKHGFPGVQIIGQLLHEPELREMFARDLIAPRLRLVESVLRDAESAGELDAGTATPLPAGSGPALIMQQALLSGPPPSRGELTRIIDTVLGQRSG